MQSSSPRGEGMAKTSLSRPVTPQYFHDRDIYLRVENTPPTSPIRARCSSTAHPQVVVTMSMLLLLVAAIAAPIADINVARPWTPTSRVRTAVPCRRFTGKALLFRECTRKTLLRLFALSCYLRDAVAD